MSGKRNRKIVISEYLDCVSYFLLWVEITTNLISNESVWLHSPVLIIIRLICENEPPCFIMKNNHIFYYVAPDINKSTFTIWERFSSHVAESVKLKNVVRSISLLCFTCLTVHTLQFAFYNCFCSIT